MIAVCLKFTARGGPDDDRFSGVSAADQAALETALLLSAAGGDEVLAVAAGPRAVRRILRDALACGARRALHIECAPDGDSRDIAFELAAAVRGADVVVCGDHSLDRGSGSVPAFIAHHLHAAQALGLVSVEAPAPAAQSIKAVRRLDGGRREVLEVPLPCVLSVEGSVASLRRAALPDALASTAAAIEHRIASPPHHFAPPAVVTPFRPRARTLPAPAGDDVLGRLRLLTDAVGHSAHGEHVELTPRAGAERIVEVLREWGHVT
ncbi:MAG: mycofactocin-associated electron transfer flavoprotein beta subunit [Actinomycetota bacterium]|jgi:electron transfer flavoprotein beta subunit